MDDEKLESLWQLAPHDYEAREEIKKYFQRKFGQAEQAPPSLDEIEIIYDGRYPNLCSGNLSVRIFGVLYKFPQFCLSSGGSASWDPGYVEEGEWRVSSWPDEIPGNWHSVILDKINSDIHHGCCGGCI